MQGKKHNPEQIIKKLREAEAMIATGKTIGQVVKDFQAQLPAAKVYVFDNNCTDRTAQFAEAAGAVVIPVYRQGKGAVARAMFREVDADLYVMVDGDDTYPAAAVHRLIEPVRKGRRARGLGRR